MDLKTIITPTLLLDKNRAIANIDRMISSCNKQGKILRPHFKTHQSLEVGRWFRSSGITRITVSSVNMAEYFAADGWEDILIAFPYNPREINRLNDLASKINLTIIVPSVESAILLSGIQTTGINVMIKIDTGYGRSGTPWDDNTSLLKILNILNTNNSLKVTGLLSHSGHTYKTNASDQVKHIYSETVDRMNECRNKLGKNDLIISVGDTPSASIVDNYLNVNELRPGNFVFYDLMQHYIGSCKLDNISVAMACPVVDIQNNRRKAVLYGGGVHLSKESVKNNGLPVYGMAVSLNKDGWLPFDIDFYVTSLSQEHGIIESEHALPPEFKIGELIGIIPVHSCLTANLAGSYTLLSGENVDHMNKRRI